MKLQFFLFRLFNHNPKIEIPSDISKLNIVNGYQLYGNYYGLYNSTDKYNVEPKDDLDRCAMIHDLELLEAKNKYLIFMTFVNLTNNLIKTLKLKANDDSSLCDKFVIYIERIIFKTIFISISIIATIFIKPQNKSTNISDCNLKDILINQQNILNAI